AVTASIARSRGQKQLERYLGVNGWTLKRNIILTPAGGEPRIVGREDLFFAADGRRRKVTYHIEDDGTETHEHVERVTVMIPDHGVFDEISRDQRLVYFADYRGFGGDVDVNQERKALDYVRDEQILGYSCALHRTSLPDGTVMESYDGYNFAAFPLKVVSQNEERVQIWEPTAIEIGGVPESVLVYHAEWPVDFSLFEKQIRRMRSENPSDPRYAQEAERMQQTLEKAKQRVGRPRR
ncbi:MAG: hypothetical protein ACREEM_23715, partial [Blastocatellia bacterium]